MSAIELRALGDESTFLSFLTHQGLYSYAVAATIAELASVLVLPTLGSGNVLRVAPPLVISDQQLELAVDGIEAVFQLLDRNPVQTIIRALGVLDEPAAKVAAAGDNKPTRSVARNGKSACGAVRDEDSMSGLVPHLRLGAPRPDYAFIVHYTSLEDVVATDPYLRGLGANELKRFCSFTGAFAPGVVMEAPPIRSKTGAAVNGLILGLPLLPEEMAHRGRRFVSQQIRQLVDLAWRLGARIVGLGGYTTPYSRRGLEVVGRGPAITTGNPLTAGMAFLATRRLLEARGLGFGETRAAVVGAAGSVGALCARLLARERPRRLVLIGSPAGDTERLLRLSQELERETHTSVAVATDLRALATCQVVMTATAAGRPILDEAPLAPGTIICDVARPPDTSARLRARTDLSIIEGGRVALPDPTIRFGVGNLQNLPDGVTLACLAETILLALEGERRDCGVGDDVPLAAVDRMLALAARHGFRLPDSTGRRHASARISAGDSVLSASIA